MTTPGVYPVRVDASLDPVLSRWLWIFKWLIVIPHLIALVFLWMAFFVVSIGAFVAILFTGSYPRPLFEFNVGVLRWSWRVFYYAYGALATDQYPPFTLAEVPGYPAHLEVEYPARLSRGLVLVKWWLLAIPHYIVIGFFLGGGTWFALRSSANDYGWAGVGLIGILVLVAAVLLLFTGRYPRQLFDFVLGMNRWVLRVAAYVGLMTDKYPPFRLDMGGHEPGSTLTLQPAGPSPTGWSTVEPPQAGPSPGEPQEPAGAQPPPGSGGAPVAWTAGRVTSVVIGALLVLTSLGMLGGGGAGLWATTAHRHGGYVDLTTDTYSTTGYALATTAIDLNANGNIDVIRSLIGTVRIRVTSTNTSVPIFVGIADSAAASRYLANVDYATVPGGPSGPSSYVAHSGGRPATAPGQAGIWVAQASGSTAVTLTWPAQDGMWTVVVMNADGSPVVGITASAAATLPPLGWIAGALLAGGVILLVAGLILIVIPAKRAVRS